MALSRKLIVACAVGALWAGAAQAATTVYQNNLSGFNTAAGSPPIAIDFEALSGNIAGTNHSGVTFSSPDGNTLDVVNGNNTFTTGANFTGIINASTNKLFPTSGTNVLSPGGLDLVAGPALGEEDSLQLDFTVPVTAVGLDVLFQSLDCCTFTNYAVYDTSLGLLASGSLVGNGGGGGDPGGSDFWGVVSDVNIGRIVFTESDGNNAFPDDNIGYDSIRFSLAAAPGGVPEPATWALMIAGVGLAGAALRRSRTRATA